MNFSYLKPNAVKLSSEPSISFMHVITFITNSLIWRIFKLSTDMNQYHLLRMPYGPRIKYISEVKPGAIGKIHLAQRMS